MSSRLFQAVREKEGLAYSIYCSPSFYRDTGAIQVYAGTSIENYHRALDCIIDQLQLVLDSGIDTAEFARSKQQLKGNIIINLEGSSAWANWLGRKTVYLLIWKALLLGPLACLKFLILKRNWIRLP